jgi:hypothetical protein
MDMQKNGAGLLTQAQGYWRAHSGVNESATTAEGALSDNSPSLEISF